MRYFPLLLLSIFVSAILLTVDYYQGHPIIGYSYSENGDGDIQETVIRL